MHLLLNDKEIAHFLLSLIDYRKSFPDIFNKNIWENTNSYLQNTNTNVKNFNVGKFKDKVKKNVTTDLKKFVEDFKNELRIKKERNYEIIHGNIEHFIQELGKETIFKLYLKNKKENFVKSTGTKLTNSPVLIRRKDFKDFSKDCLIRNTVGNEILLVTKLDNNYPFWFIDSGYTNFIEDKKVFHRIVRNHLHSDKMFEAPVDRLGLFKKFPNQWRQSGEKILVVEPGPFAAAVFHIDLKTWRYEVEQELRKYTDKPIVFREKVDKKIRSNLYREFCDEDYYCVISLNSNASTEAIWAGIPAITLGKHITNPVSKSSLSDINDLYRPHLANWLCMLSYSQFTYEELINGVAVNIIKKYHV